MQMLGKLLWEGIYTTDCFSCIYVSLEAEISECFAASTPQKPKKLTDDNKSKGIRNYLFGQKLFFFYRRKLLNLRKKNKIRNNKETKKGKNVAFLCRVSRKSVLRKISESSLNHRQTSIDSSTAKFDRWIDPRSSADWLTEARINTFTPSHLYECARIALTS